MSQSQHNWPHVGGPDENGQVRCEHGELTPIRTSHSDANPGREYYSCFLHFSNRNKCGYFAWANELPNNQVPPLGSQSQNTQVSQNTSRPSQRQRASANSPLSTSSSSTKRSRSATPPPSMSPATPTRERHMPLTPQSKNTPSSALTPSQREARYAGIQGALAAPALPSPQFESSQRYGQSANDDLDSPSPQKRSRTTVFNRETDPLAPDEEARRAMAARKAKEARDAENAFWSDSSSRSNVMQHKSSDFSDGEHNLQAPGSSSTPRAQPLGGSILNGLLTPPRSSQVSQEFAHSAVQHGTAAPETPTKSKGKGREISAPASQWQNIQDDVENPFHKRAAALRTQPAGVHDDTMASGSGDSTSANSIAAAISELSNVPNYVLKLERKLKAAQKSAEAKANRITELENENQRLQSLIRALETSVHALTARH